MQRGHDNDTLTYQVILDAAHDLNEAGQCTCAGCCDAFAARYVEAADELANELTEADGQPVEIGVYRATYESADAHDVWHDPHEYWQRIHDRTSWGTDDATSVHAEAEAEGE
jgi:hypothetical protein